MEQNFNTGAPVAPVTVNKQKSSNGLKVAAAIAYVMAICGIGFGVYGMLQSTQKDGQISTTQAQVENSDKNPIISATNSEEDEYINDFTIPNNFHIFDYDTGDRYSLGISLKDGEIVGCELYSVFDNVNTLEHECTISGITEKIYKAGYLAHGQMGNPPVAFITQNGAVYYFELNDALEMTNIHAKQLDTGGFVTDIVDEISVFTKSKSAAEDEGGSGYVTSALVYSDGTYKTYDSLFTTK